MPNRLSRPRVPYDGEQRAHRRLLAEAVNRLLAGQMDCTTMVTFNASATQTTLQDARISANTNAILTPDTADAAVALPGAWWNCTNGVLTINHASSSATDQTFTVSLLG